MKDSSAILGILHKDKHTHKKKIHIYSKCLLTERYDGIRWIRLAQNWYQPNGPCGQDHDISRVSPHKRLSFPQGLCIVNQLTSEKKKCVQNFHVTPAACKRSTLSGGAALNAAQSDKRNRSPFVVSVAPTSQSRFLFL